MSTKAQNRLRLRSANPCRWFTGITDVVKTIERNCGVSWTNSNDQDLCRPSKLRPRFEGSARLTKTNFHFRYTYLGHPFPVLSTLITGMHNSHHKIYCSPSLPVQHVSAITQFIFYLLQDLAHNTHFNALHEASKSECVAAGTKLPDTAKNQWRYCVTHLSHLCQIGLLRNRNFR